MDRTIAAIATPPGEGGIAIIRISGKSAVHIADQVFSGSVPSYGSHTAHLGHVTDAGQKIDQALLLFMKGPNSYTGEDTVELQCHGGVVASRKVLEAVLQAGAKAALPGEFTYQAFMNGKLDLTQAEAVQQLIGAKGDVAFSMASKQLAGSLSQKIASFQHRLTGLAAILEAWVDFPEEGLEFASREELVSDLQAVKLEMAHLLSTFEDGRKKAYGIKLCLVGAPNAGKSSLMNALLDQERAIVTPVAGTTRDLLHEEMSIKGLTFRLTDTAGLRETDELVEKEGVRRSCKAINEADLVLWVIDASAPLPKLNFELPKDKSLVAFNKIDLPHKIATVDFPYQVELSAKSGEGIEQLREMLTRIVWEKGVDTKEEVFLTSTRHKEALQEAHGFCDAVKQGLVMRDSPELLTADMRSSLLSLGRIIGTDVTEEILSSIFSNFCIGK